MASDFDVQVPLQPTFPRQAAATERMSSTQMRILDRRRATGTSGGHMEVHSLRYTPWSWEKKNKNKLLCRGLEMGIHVTMISGTRVTTCHYKISSVQIHLWTLG